MIITLGRLIVNVKKIHPAIKDNIPFTTSMSDPMKASMNVMRKLAKKDGAQIKNGVAMTIMKYNLSVFYVKMVY